MSHNKQFHPRSRRGLNATNALFFPLLKAPFPSPRSQNKLRPRGSNQETQQTEHKQWQEDFPDLPACLASPRLCKAPLCCCWGTRWHHVPVPSTTNPFPSTFHCSYYQLPFILHLILTGLIIFPGSGVVFHPAQVLDTELAALEEVSFVSTGWLYSAAVPLPSSDVSLPSL